MPEPTLTIDIRLTAHPNEIHPTKLDALLDGELRGFQEWVIGRNKAAGLEGAPLSALERLAVKSYLIYAATRGEA